MPSLIPWKICTGYIAIVYFSSQINIMFSPSSLNGYKNLASFRIYNARLFILSDKDPNRLLFPEKSFPIDFTVTYYRITKGVENLLKYVIEFIDLVWNRFFLEIWLESVINFKKRDIIYCSSLKDILSFLVSLLLWKKSCSFLLLLKSNLLKSCILFNVYAAIICCSTLQPYIGSYDWTFRKD